jgi:hypothetical protein
MIYSCYLLHNSSIREVIVTVIVIVVKLTDLIDETDKINIKI